MIRCRIVWPAANQLSLLNCVACRELVFAVIEFCGLQRTSFRCRIVWPAANQLLLLNCVPCSKTVFAVELGGQQRISFAVDFLQ
jgi:hypothetical protein